jgi:hypothetical protein
MDWRRDFEIGMGGQHYRLYYGLKVPVPPPSRSLELMTAAEYCAYCESTLFALQASPEYRQRRIEIKQGAPFVME